MVGDSKCGSVYSDIFRSYSTGCGITPAPETIEPCFAKELQMAIQTANRTEKRYGDIGGSVEWNGGGGAPYRT